MPEDQIMVELPPFRVWNRGGDRPVLALHCSLAHSGAWTGVAEHLTGVTLTATDQPSHGRAPDWDRTSDLHSLTTRLSIGMAEQIGGGQAIDLIGHSFGATVALRMALDRPDLVRSLTLIEPVIFAAARQAKNPAFAPFEVSHTGFEDLVRTGQMDAAARAFHAIWGSGDILKDLPEKTRRYMIDRIYLIEAQNPYLLGDRADLLRSGGLESVRVPVLLIEGATSPAIIDAIHTELARRLPNARRLSVAGAGHMVPITHAALIGPDIRAHLAAC